MACTTRLDSRAEQALRAATLSLEPHLLDLRKDVFPTRTTQSTTTSKVTDTDNDMEAKKIGSTTKGNGMVSAAAIERVMGKATNRDSKEREDDYITPSDDVEEVIKTVWRRRAVEEPQPQPTEPVRRASTRLGSKPPSTAKPPSTTAVTITKSPTKRKAVGQGIGRGKRIKVDELIPEPRSAACIQCI
ncbi:hypothetical protein M422DRAFT_260691 [Sphaerobolus stellatus SS14]|uniref:Unplaced genomic scaffold SPHSTscaffold_99, whole genome shotgun sequence n=1 Tax=Sphaerobolus stellatus (strain SS14) TaxID=990650 RepID=A0A0C9UQ24_SPHS4|nr:hypothetical protein M422DRAFT_260691 [Sphaerobolus stellatus SS14]